ncbi:type II toxin-antitoxin system RelE/ParE family toxin [Kamptonema animale CS-326]|jgi:putative addiction module killer protein|uniref:type II toxin-antitoxin system RelE/ParE family toxin n=1 Tax=Kamptonema animale TaxID=92934 RepID=UPI00232E8743|nr:type II toxin-antitoxin system RelE/ParE family toxin [Kamptonema animale]MDB9512047.1 type II toxin-antitoxin system RelE/ParE family toxin [Kamptonema animale CS-326]
MEVEPRQIENYLRADGTSPFENWYDSLRDTRARNRIQLRLKRVIAGNLGDCGSVGEGVFELKIDYGPGYRVYFGQVGLTIILLLVGGDKSTQERDIKKAIGYWSDYEQRCQNTDE